jgi:16S rRNA (guanine966-N2)-methyltransferase
MRIIAGRHRGRALVTPPGLATRPTAARVREAVFNILTHGLDWPGFAGAQGLDLFAGSGAAGFEALSRGAAFATFIDQAGAALAAIRRNAEALGEADRVRLLRLDATRLGPPPAGTGTPADLAFLDAPYGAGLTLATLTALLRGGWLKPRAMIVVEIAAKEPFTPPASCTRLDERAWGAARVLFLAAPPAP